MEMSFLGCIGYLMAAFGLEEIPEVVYARNSAAYAQWQSKWLEL